MYFDSLSDALSMAGHGGYVWSAYAICVAVIALLLFWPIRRRQVLMRDIAGELRRREGSVDPTAAEGSRV